MMGARKGPPMERFTLSLDDALAHPFDAFIAAKRKGNRSKSCAT